ncbi:hypothetical protein [Halorubrum sp. GN11GM_10-3_MGM]|uniref:hypothetical protein n=1 Tax=Halorubrum sp. GN11GM_10-3_MGM TaxID=2518111 RepID=UPI0010F70452|nr:hypothetical protein [Halorubrum sp. GN11GM_10-3_MGM]TKX72386.1 hypothetical protein EXE40_03745 [Halorubrum sp. GN11GM_10-3_MGM]
MPSTEIKIQSLRQPILQALFWFVVVMVYEYLITGGTLFSALLTAIIGASFYGALIYFWDVY